MSEKSEGSDRRKAMKKFKSKKSSKSSGNLSIQLPLKHSKSSKAKSPVNKHTRVGSSGSQSVRTGPLVNFAVPPLQLETPTKKSGREGGKNLRSHKGGAGFKSRCTDHERWHQYQVDEGNFSEPNFLCPFVFIGKEVACEPATPKVVAEGDEGAGGEKEAEPVSAVDANGASSPKIPREESPKNAVTALKLDSPPPSPKGRKRPERNMSRRELRRRPGNRDLGFHVSRKLSMLDDTFEIVHSVVQFKTLEQFNVKKFDHMGFVEWEAVWHEKVLDQVTQDKDKKSLKKMREKSMGVIGSGTSPRSRSRSRGPDSQGRDKEKEKRKRSDSKTRSSDNKSSGNVSSVELGYGNVHAHVNPLKLLQAEERSRSLTHKKEKTRRSTLTGLAPQFPLVDDDEGPRTSRVTVIDPKTISEEEEKIDPTEPTEDESEQNLSGAEVPVHSISEPGIIPAATLGASPRSQSISKLELMPGARVIRVSSSEDNIKSNPYMLLCDNPSMDPIEVAEAPKPVGFLPLLNQEDIESFVYSDPSMPRRSSSAKANLSGSSSRVNSLSLSGKDHSDPVSPRVAALSGAEGDHEDSDNSASKSISPLRLFSPRKKPKRPTSPSSPPRDGTELASPTVKSGLKRKKSGYFSTLKLQLKTPRGKAKEEEGPPTPKKKKAKPRKKLRRKKTAMSFDDDYAMDGSYSARSRRALTDSNPEPRPLVPEKPKSAPPPPGRLAGLSDFLEEYVCSDDEQHSVNRSQSHRVELRAADSDQTPSVVAALVVAEAEFDKRSNRLSLPLSLRSPRHLVSKSDTEAGLIRHGPVRFEDDTTEQDAPSDET